MGVIHIRKFKMGAQQIAVYEFDLFHFGTDETRGVERGIGEDDT